MTTPSDNVGQMQTRRRFIHKLGSLAGGIARLGLLRRVPLAEAKAKDSHVEHLGEGPDEPLYLPRNDNEASFGWLPALDRTYEACKPGDEACGYCTSTAYYCAGRYSAGNGNYYCYEWTIRDRHCGADNISCNYEHYCSRSTWWGSRRYGPAGCI